MLLLTLILMSQFGLPYPNRYCIGRTNGMGQHNRIGNTQAAIYEHYHQIIKTML